MSERLRLVRRARLKRDTVRGVDVLLVPESVIELNAQAAEIVRLCDGTHTLEGIVAHLTARYGTDEVDRDVRAFVERLRERGLLEAGS